MTDVTEELGKYLNPNFGYKVWNEDKTRLVSSAGLAIALYEGEVIDGVFEGLHAGCVETAEEANAWLNGDNSVKKMIVYGEDATR